MVLKGAVGVAEGEVLGEGSFTKTWIGDDGNSPIARR
jgi:hypothetical protein